MNVYLVTITNVNTFIYYKASLFIRQLSGLSFGLTIRALGFDLSWGRIHPNHLQYIIGVTKSLRLPKGFFGKN